MKIHLYRIIYKVAYVSTRFELERKSLKLSLIIPLFLHVSSIIIDCDLWLIQVPRPNS